MTFTADRTMPISSDIHNFTRAAHAMFHAGRYPYRALRRYQPAAFSDIECRHAPNNQKKLSLIMAVEILRVTNGYKALCGNCFDLTLSSFDNNIPGSDCLL